MTKQIYKAPKTPEYTNYLIDIPRTDADAQAKPLAKMQRLLLSRAERNTVYSPLCIYHCAAILAEVTRGNCRRQITDLLGGDEDSRRKFLESALRGNNAVFSGNFRKCTSITGASLWLSGGLEFDGALLQRLGSAMNTDSFLCDMKSGDSAEAAGRWLAEHTGGFLKKSRGITLSDKTAFELLSTIYLSARWQNGFDKKLSAEGIFHGPRGDVKCRYMSSHVWDDIFSGEGFTAYKRVASNCDMWFILPDENVSAGSIADNGDCLQMLLHPEKAHSEYAEIDLKIPLFDVSEKLDISGFLRAAGVTDIFDDEKCDMTEFIKTPVPVCADKAEHSARLRIDEEGLEAAAFTEMGFACAGLPRKPPVKINFRLDRPFLFAVTGFDRTVLMSGIMTDPSACG